MKTLSRSIVIGALAALAWPVFALTAPTINIYPDVYYPYDEILYLEGNATPDMTVQVQFTKQGSGPLTFTTKSDVRGGWVLAEKIPLDAGDWEVHARIATHDDASDWSNPRVFKALVTGVTIGGANVRFGVLLFLLFVLLFIGGATVVYFLWKIKQLKMNLVSKEVQEANDTMREGITELRHDLLDELRESHSTDGKHSGGGLAKKEHMLREMDQLEKNLQKEIKDISDKI